MINAIVGNRNDNIMFPNASDINPHATSTMFNTNIFLSIIESPE